MEDARRSAPGRLEELAAAIAACRVCLDDPRGRPLPHAPNPVVRMSSTARLCIAGQAPGTRVHASGVPFTDPSGDRLRDWLGIDRETFYDRRRVAIVPMGFCFPGLDAHGGDLPPRRECRETWHARVFAAMPQLELVLAIGAHAQAFHLGAGRRATVTQTVLDYEAILRADRHPRVLPLPHPSWRNNAWLKKNPWFERELLPLLRGEVARLTGGDSAGA